MGPSGCGKTTLLNCLSGLDAIDGGEVAIEGVALSAMSDRERTDYRARRMGFVFQYYNLMPVLTAVENVELPLLVARRRGREARRRALEALELVGLPTARGHVPGRALGRRAPARDDRARARQRPGDRLGRRADRRPRQRRTPSEITALLRRLNRRARADAADRHARPRRRRRATDRIVRMVDGAVVDRGPAVAPRPPSRGRMLMRGCSASRSDALALGLALALGVVLGVVAVLALRNRVLLRLGLRNLRAAPAARR